MTAEQIAAEFGTTLARYGVAVTAVALLLFAAGFLVGRKL